MMTADAPMAPVVIGGRRKISVLIPSYNHADYIGEAIESVLSQDWPDLELLLLDDGSSDDTLDRALAAVRGQTRVPCRLESQPNAGVCATLNRLMDRAEGDVIAILNSDDRFAPGRLRRIMERVGGAQVFFGFSRVSFIESGTTLDFADMKRWYSELMAKGTALPSAGFMFLLANLSISSSNFVFSRDLAAKTGGFDGALPLTQDWDFVLRCLRFVEPVFAPEPLLEYRVHPSNTWRQHTAIRFEQSEAVVRGYFENLERIENPMAPAPGAWPRFFPVFLSVARPVFATDNLASVVEAMNLHRATPGPPHTASAASATADGAAIRRLVTAITAEPPDDADPLIPQLVADQWSAMRAHFMQ